MLNKIENRCSRFDFIESIAISALVEYLSMWCFYSAIYTYICYCHYHCFCCCWCYCYCLCLYIFVSFLFVLFLLYLCLFAQMCCFPCDEWIYSKVRISGERLKTHQSSISSRRIISSFITMTSYWARWRLKSPASLFFTQLSGCQANIGATEVGK